MLEAVTIIIPTHNRHNYLKRILDYYSSCTFRIIVVDSTKTAFKNEVKKNVEYYHVPDVPYFQKLQHYLHDVKTKYTVLCADDDFVIPDSIQQCVDFLEEDSTYFSAQGNHVYFFDDLFAKCYPSLLYTYGLDVNQEKPSERIKQVFETYTPFHYTVHRTVNLTDTFDYFIDLPDILGGVSQYFLDIISVTNGKHKILPIFYYAREISFTSGAFTMLNVSTFLNDQKLIVEFEKIVDLLAINLSKKEKIDLQEAKNVIWGVFRNSEYFNPRVSKNVDDANGSSPVKNKLIKRIINVVPYIKFFKSIYSNHVYKQYFIDREDLAKAQNLIGYPYSDKKALKDWKKMRRKIFKHWFSVFFSKPLT